MPASPVLHQTRASCAALRTAEELHGGAGTSSGGRSLVAVLVSIFTILSTVACGATGDAAEVDERLRFEGSAPSMEVLGRQVLEALTRGDTAALERVRLTELQHNEAVWPELPASAPEVNFPVDYAWTNIQNRNRRALSRTLPAYAQRTLIYDAVECRGETEPFRTFEVHTDCWIVFTSGEDPRRWEVQAFKDVLSRGGGYKIFRYYDEEPRPYGGATRP